MIERVITTEWIDKPIAPYYVTATEYRSSKRARAAVEVELGAVVDQQPVAD